MKNYSQLFPNKFYEVHIKWSSKPIKLSENWEQLTKINQDNTYLYKIYAKRGDKCKLIYIGMTEAQDLHRRLYNWDHQLKQNSMREKNNRWVLYLSVGEYIIKNEDFDSYKWATKNTKIIEKLLIISHTNMPSLMNKKSINWFSTGEWLTIKNQGFLKDGFLKTISYGIFCK
jgi:hypothetical protein